MLKAPRLAKIDPSSTGKFEDDKSGKGSGKERGKEKAKAATEKLHERLYHNLHRLYADGRHSLLVILQGIDAAGKDGTVKNLFAGANPQGIRVYSFKQPSEEELAHDFLWRCHKHAPQRGYAAIFNRSYYEEVTTVKVHPEYLERQRLPAQMARGEKLFRQRYRQINEFERLLTENGTVVLKFLLHISKDEQRKRLLERMNDPSKHWKFQEGDIEERRSWPAHMRAFDEMLVATHTEHAPWLVVPADKKWYRDYLVAEATVGALDALHLAFPKVKIRAKARTALQS